MSDLKKSVCSAIDEMRDTLLGLSHHIHANPELAFREFIAAEALTNAVEEAGLSVTRGAFGLETGYASEFGDTEGNGTVAILSEYDALPGIGHSCGHNIIAASGLGAALALSKVPGWRGKLRYLGTPAEERGGGKEIMAQNGAFDGVDAALMVHPAGLDLTTMPSIALSSVEAVYDGQSAHASAMPHRGLNALDGVVISYQAIAALRQHIRPSERIHGIITDGGKAPNIVPDRAAALYYIRAQDASALAKLKARVKACLEAGAAASGTQVTLNWAQVDYLDLKTNDKLANAYDQNIRALGREPIDASQMPSSFAGSTDMGNVSHRVPSIHPMISCAPPNVVIHNPEFAKWAGSDKGDAAVLDGAKALAMTAIDYFENDALRTDAHTEFQESEKTSREAVSLAFDETGVMEIGGCGCS